MADWLTATAGTAIILLLIADVFGTIAHPEGRGGPLNRRQNRLLWRTFRRITPERREQWLSYGAPLMVGWTLIFWVLLLILGFTLVYLPWIDTFLVSPGSLRTPVLEAFYFSAYTASTLGFGDVVANEESLRLLGPVQATIGFALVSVSVTYLLSTYREVLQKHTTAAVISGWLDANEVTGLGDTRSLPADAVDRWASDVDSSLRKVLEAHFLYPILHYFRASKEDSALPVQVARLVALRGTETPAWVGEECPSLRALFATVDDYLERIDELFLPPGFNDRGAAGDGHNAAARADRLLRYMRHR